MVYRKKRSYRRRPYSRRNVKSRPRRRPYAPLKSVEVKKQVFYLGVDGFSGSTERFLPAGHNGTATTLFIPPTISKQSGIAPSQTGTQVPRQPTGPIIGTDIYRRYMSTKVKLTFPCSRPNLASENPTQPLFDGHIYTPTEVFLIWGWHHPIDLTKFTTPNADNINWSDTTENQNGSLTEEVIKRIAPYYDTPHEFMEFQDAASKSFIIEGFKKVRPDRMNQVQIPQMLQNVATGHTNAPPTWQYHIKWKYGMNRTVHHHHSTGVNHWYPEHSGFWYPGNGEPIPFVLIYNPKYETQGVARNTLPADLGNNHPAVGKIKYELSFCEWFNDA